MFSELAEEVHQGRDP